MLRYIRYIHIYIYVEFLGHWRNVHSNLLDIAKLLSKTSLYFCKLRVLVATQAHQHNIVRVLNFYQSDICLKIYFKTLVFE